jgi:hypothetical protein
MVSISNSDRCIGRMSNCCPGRGAEDEIDSPAAQHLGRAKLWSSANVRRPNPECVQQVGSGVPREFRRAPANCLQNMGITIAHLCNTGAFA